MAEQNQAVWNRYAQAMLEALRSHKELYEGLLALAKEKRDVLVQNNVQRLEEITREEGLLLKRVSAINEDFENIKAQWRQQCGEDSPGNLTEFAQKTQDQTLRERASELQRDFLFLAEELQRNNAINQRLVETHLQYNDFCIELFTQEETVGDFYGSKGYVQDQPSTGSRGFINRKV